MTEINDVLEHIVVPTPLLLNICNNDNNILAISQTSSIIDLTSKHKWLGDYYYFKQQLEGDISKNLQKYAVFVDYNTKYILSDISKINDKQKKDFITKSSLEVFNCLFFHQNGSQYWYLKSNKYFTRI